MDRTGNTDKHFDSKEKVNDFSRNQTGDSASRVVYVVRGSHHQPSELPLALLVFKGVVCRTFDHDVGQRVQQGVVGHQLLVHGVLKAHGAGVGPRPAQVRLHGRVDQQGVSWTHPTHRHMSTPPRQRDQAALLLCQGEWEMDCIYFMFFWPRKVF